MTDFVIVPQVNAAREFTEIATDFSNPLDLVREAISNSFDAKATEIEISFEVIKPSGKRTVQITIKDNGEGMAVDGLQAFFDLGNSLRRNDPHSIGEKGHGTKVFFNSSSIDVATTQNGVTLKAHLDSPYDSLYAGTIPSVACRDELTPEAPDGTIITITGYNSNDSEKFTHEILKDHILWFTKFGSIEKEFGINTFSNVKLYLKGLNRLDPPEEIQFGHKFPQESLGMTDLFEKHLVKAPDLYCRRRIFHGSLRKYPDISYQAVFSIEGNQVKYQNEMVRRRGYPPPKGAYTVQERYGLWLCKDFIPVQRKNEWITKKGSEYTKFHAFINCQDLQLTANRGSCDNTPFDVMNQLAEETSRIYSQIVESEDWIEMESLESGAEAVRTAEKEKKEFSFRRAKINRCNIATYKGITLVEPHRETGVFSMVIQLMTVEQDLFPFRILDYDSYSGIDVIVSGRPDIPIKDQELQYAEFKYILESTLNHSFQNLHSIICWNTELKHGSICTDIMAEQRTMFIANPEKPNDYRKYFLENPRHAHRIEVYVLSDYLKQRLGLDFRARTIGECV